jgi:hypothetical protein
LIDVQRNPRRQLLQGIPQIVGAVIDPEGIIGSIMPDPERQLGARSGRLYWLS